MRGTYTGLGCLVMGRRCSWDGRKAVWRGLASAQKPAWNMGLGAGIHSKVTQRGPENLLLSTLSSCLIRGKCFIPAGLGGSLRICPWFWPCFGKKRP